MGSVGAPFDKTSAETLKGLVKTDIIHHPEHEPWKTFDKVKYSMLGWVDLSHCSCGLLSYQDEKFFASE